MNRKDRRTTVDVVARRAAVVLALAAMLAACNNPMLVQMSEQIATDVQSAVAGEPPVVTEVSPVDGAADVAPSVLVELSFSLPLAAESVTVESVYIIESETESPVAAGVAYDDETRVVTISPDTPLAKATEYTIVATRDVSSSSGARPAAQFESTFTTASVREDEIVIDLSYGGPYQFNQNYPIWIALLPHPFDTDENGAPLDEVYETKVTSQGLISIPQAELPSAGAQDGTYFVLLTHDLSNDYASVWDGASVSTQGWLDPTRESGLSTDGTDADGNQIVQSYAPSITVAESVQIAVGNIYSVTYTDTPLVESDVDEPNDDRASAATGIELHTAYPRTLGWEDEDWFEFVPEVSDDYRIVVARNPYDPDHEDGLDLDFPVQLSVYVYDSGSGGIAHKGTDYDDSGTSADDYGLVDTSMQAGELHYIHVSGAESLSIGEYVLKIIPREVDYDVDEPNNTYVVGGGTEIPFGYNNYLERTAHKYDTDFYWFDTTGLQPYEWNPDSSDSFAFALRADQSPWDDTVLAFDMNVQIDDIDADGDGFLDGTPDGTLANINGVYDQTFADLPFFRSPRGRYEFKVSNVSPGESYFQPTGAYLARFVYGPDFYDYDLGSQEYRSDGWRDDTRTSVSVQTIYASDGGAVSYHTIYPATDVDYVEIDSGAFDMLAISLEPAEIYGNLGLNAFYGDLTLYDSTGAEYGTYPTSYGSAYVSLDSSDGHSAGDIWYIKLSANANSPIPTGAYKITVTGY